MVCCLLVKTIRRTRLRTWWYTLIKEVFAVWSEPSLFEWGTCGRKYESEYSIGFPVIRPLTLKRLLARYTLVKQFSQFNGEIFKTFYSTCAPFRSMPSMTSARLYKHSRENAANIFIALLWVIGCNIDFLFTRIIKPQWRIVSQVLFVQHLSGCVNIPGLRQENFHM